MAFVLDDVVQIVGTAKTVAAGIRKVADALKGGLRGNVSEVKAELAERVAALEDTLDSVGALARFGEAYARSHEDVLALLFLCRRAERVLNDSADDLRNKDRAGHDAAWRVLETLFDGMDLNLVHRVQTERQEWYDTQDRIQLNDLLRRFAESHAKAGAQLKIRSADGLRAEVEDMRDALSRTESVLRSTLYDKVLETLQRVGS